MKTGMQFDAMEKALPYAAELVDCQELKELKKTMKDSKGMSNGDVMKALLPIFLKEKRETVFALLGAISGKTPEKIAAQEWEETKKLLESPIMEDFMIFFGFSARMAKGA